MFCNLPLATSRKTRSMTAKENAEKAATSNKTESAEVYASKATSESLSTDNGAATHGDEEL